METPTFVGLPRPRTGCCRLRYERSRRAVAEGSKVGNTLLELRRTVEDLDPSRATGVRKFLGVIPFGDKVTDYFRRYESAQGHLNGILHALRNGRTS